MNCDLFENFERFIYSYIHNTGDKEMPKGIKEIRIVVTQSEYERLVENKEGRSWHEILMSLVGGN